MEETRPAAPGDLPETESPSLDPNSTLQKQTRDDRVRTLDQIKRLYAVMMGLAATHCITEAIARIQRDHLGWDQVFVIVGHGIIFGSLIILFFLGAERYLDRKYLRPGIDNPSWKSLTLDIGCLGVSSVWFVVLGRSVSAPINDIVDYDFAWNLVILYVLDIIILVLQYLDISRAIPECDETRRCKEVYKLWVVVNIYSIIAVSLLAYLAAPCLLRVTESLNVTIYILAASLLVIHLIRFVLDFSRTLDFYYPLANERVD